jgi:hypothetical protein
MLNLNGQAELYKSVGDDNVFLKEGLCRDLAAEIMDRATLNRQRYSIKQGAQVYDAAAIEQHFTKS